jgi:putative PIN family toxin of toxin-antitoxin system
VRIALDTSVLIAALAKPSGAAGRIVQAWRAGEIENVASEATLCEAELVIGAGWAARLASPSAVDALLRDLAGRSVRVTPPAISDLSLKDEGDLRLVEAAVAAHADYVVTADRELLGWRGYGGVEFVTATEFWRRWSTARPSPPPP